MRSRRAVLVLAFVLLSSLIPTWSSLTAVSAPVHFAFDTPLNMVNASWSGPGCNYAVGDDLSGAGDVNGDGYPDFLIGAISYLSGSGQVFLILGGPHSSSWTMDMSTNNANASFIGEGGNEHLGVAVSGGGDLNGDGFDDIVIGAENNGEAAGGAGKVYIIFGRADNWSMN